MVGSVELGHSLRMAFTPMSLLPEAAAHRGISFGQLVDRLVRRAAGRVARSERRGVAVSYEEEPSVYVTTS